MIIQGEYLGRLNYDDRRKEAHVRVRLYDEHSTEITVCTDIGTANLLNLRSIKETPQVTVYLWEGHYHARRMGREEVFGREPGTSKLVLPLVA